MRISHLTGLLAALLLIPLQPLAAEGEPPFIQARQLTAEGVGPGRWDYGFHPNGAPWVAYYSADQRLLFRDADGTEKVLRANPRASQPTGLEVVLLKGKPAVAWRHKAPQQIQGIHLALPGQVDTPVRLAGPDSIPLSRMRVVEAADGTLHTVWLGELPDREARRTYHIYHSALSRDGIRGKETRVFPGIYPGAIVDGNRLAVFTHYPPVGADKGRIAMRTLGADGEFGAEQVIAETAVEITPFFQATQINGRWFVVWVAQYGPMLNDFLLEGVHSGDGGKTWTHFALEEFRGADFSHVEIEGDGKQGLYLTFSATLTKAGHAGESQDLPGTDDKQHVVYFARSPDNGKTWKSQNLRPASMVSDKKAVRTSMAVAPDGKTIVLAWEDYRDIRPNVYFSHSTDGGRSWSDALPLARPGIQNMGLLSHLDLRSLRYHDGRFHLVSPRDDADPFTSGRLFLYSFTLPELEAHGRAMEKARVKPDEKRLRERVGELWNAFVAEDYRKVYAMHDPFFRTRVKEREYLTQTGMMKYYSHVIKDLQIRGTRAELHTEVEFSVPEVKFRDKTFSRERAPEVFKEVWVFVDGEWYREYRSEATEARFTPY